MIPQIELIESEHNTPVSRRDKQRLACLTTNSRYTARRAWRISENCLWHTCRQNFYRMMLYAMHSSHRIFWHITGIKKNRKLPLLSNGTTFNDRGRPTHKYTKFLSHDAMLARHILCDGPMCVSLSIRLVRRRGNAWWQVVQRDPQLRLRHPCSLLLQTHSSGVVGPYMRPIAIGAIVKQLGGQRTGFALLL